MGHFARPPCRCRWRAARRARRRPAWLPATWPAMRGTGSDSRYRRTDRNSLHVGYGETRQRQGRPYTARAWRMAGIAIAVRSAFHGVRIPSRAKGVRTRSNTKCLATVIFDQENSVTARNALTLDRAETHPIEVGNYVERATAPAGLLHGLAICSFTQELREFEIMRALQAFGVACGAVALCPRPGLAATITAHATAEVSGVATVDKYGLFGPAGTDLFGEKMDIKVSYDSAQYGASASCGTGCRSYEAVAGLNRHAATVKVTIGGVTLVYKSTVSGQVQLYNHGVGQHSFGIAANGDLTSMAGTGGGILFWCRHAIKFGAPVYKKGHFTDRPQDYFIALSAKNGKSEEISFAIE